MKTIGSHPGAILFRLGLMVIVIAILVLAFFAYLEESEKVLEHNSVLQTKRVIESSLAVVFANHAVSGRLNELDEIDGANPFEMLQRLEIPTPGYRGVIERELGDDLAPGWYYQAHRGQVAYKPQFDGPNRYFRVVLDYEDKNRSGRFDYGVDRFRNLRFVALDRL